MNFGSDPGRYPPIFKETVHMLIIAVSRLQLSYSQLDILVHHETRSSAIVFAHRESESRLRHLVGVPVVFLEDNFVGRFGLGVAEESEVDNDTGVSVLCDRTIGEGVAINLTIKMSGKKYL